MKAQNDLAYRLVLLAVRRAPPALAERLQEEWSADLESRTGTVSRLQLALNCWWATAVITRDLAVLRTCAVTTSGSAKALMDDTPHALPQLSRRTIVLLAIAGIHLLLIYAFTSGLALRVVHTFTPQTHVTITQEERRLAAAPPIAMTPVAIDRSAPKLVPPTDFTLPAEDNPAIGGSADPGSNVTPATDAPALQPPIHRMAGGPGPGFPSPDDFYPATSRRLGETGATTVQVCVDTVGRLIAVPVVLQSSGSHRLDDGALSLAKAGSGHYQPTTENGRPVSACYPYRIRFRLTD